MPKHTPAKRKANKAAAAKKAAAKKSTKLAFKGDGIKPRNKPRRRKD